jgi:hypothetical protein
MSETQQLSVKTEQKQQAAGRFDTCGLLACFLISGFLIVWITLASGTFNLPCALFLAALPWILLRAGRDYHCRSRVSVFFRARFPLGSWCCFENLLVVSSCESCKVCRKRTASRTCNAASAKLSFAGTSFIQTIQCCGRQSFAITRHSSPMDIASMTCSAVSF